MAILLVTRAIRTQDASSRIDMGNPGQLVFLIPKGHFPLPPQYNQPFIPPVLTARSNYAFLGSKSFLRFRLSRNTLLLGGRHGFYVYESGRIGYIVRVKCFLNPGHYQMVIGIVGSYLVSWHQTG